MGESHWGSLAGSAVRWVFPAVLLPLEVHDFCSDAQKLSLVSENSRQTCQCCVDLLLACLTTAR